MDCWMRKRTIFAGARGYERSADRVDGRPATTSANWRLKAGEVKLRVPKLRRLPFETAIIERYKRREASVEEALVEMYLAGVSVRRVEDITEALWGSRASSGTVPWLNQKIYRHIQTWRNREITDGFPYVFFDGVVLKRSWAGEVRNISVLIAIGVATDGFRQILGLAEGENEDLEGWRGFLLHLKDRGLKGVRRIVSDACRGLVEAIAEVFPNTDWQRCGVHFYRNAFGHTPNGKVAEVARMLKAIHALESRRAAQAKATEMVAQLREMKRIIREIRRRTRVLGAFPDGHSALMLVAARLRHIASTKWGKRRHLIMDALLNPAKQEAAA